MLPFFLDWGVALALLGGVRGDVGRLVTEAMGSFFDDGNVAEDGWEEEEEEGEERRGNLTDCPTVNEPGRRSRFLPCFGTVALSFFFVVPEEALPLPSARCGVAIVRLARAVVSVRV